ncbi:MAG: aspartate-semialdehyde dehydrogenase [Chloroflexi bacterium]|nr:aspartate-semialdehyde dehydrogenase [Chloroflexota bacterium]MCI0574986.1 aspartate-semialdehyde dehydrogenase [Chloroflexota bacterium]MCI0647707.1 aspartate-semialdehyde dehydrogenase [Chloroflexota bacterium]MCI0730933.1 aspartate-semialdehyde dehydrogenase [Chloroflexota bacterium]
MKRIPVAVLGATGAVGQRFVQLLADHPWFEVTAVTGSERTVGQPYGEGANWVIPGDPPPAVARLTVQETQPNLDVPVVLSALPAKEAWEMEPWFAEAGYAVVSNASSYRMTADVPLIIPEINPDHTGLIATQRANRNWPGFIVASPNCSTTSAILPMKIFQDAFGLEAAIMTTLQAISGAGYPGISGMLISDNVLPFISGEDDKLEMEPKKLLGRFEDGQIQMADIRLSAQANRVPVMDGHLASVSVQLGRPVSGSEAIEALQTWCPPEICAGLPSSPGRVLIYRQEPDRPQPRLDRDTDKGMAWTVGKVRRCSVLDLRYMALTHNTLRGAAGGALLNAELLVAQGYIKM